MNESSDRPRALITGATRGAVSRRGAPPPPKSEVMEETRKRDPIKQELHGV